MKTLLSILLFVGLVNSSCGSCVTDDRTLTERLFQGNAGTIFTCKILTFSTPTYPDNIIATDSNGSNIIAPEINGNIDGTATAEILMIYFGKVDTNIVTLHAGSYLTVGKTYLIYTSGSGLDFLPLSGQKS